MGHQLEIIFDDLARPGQSDGRPALALPNLDQYERILVAFSGGKDSLACVFHLLDLGCKEKIELHHHDVDGEGERFMDWPCTRAYCREVARVLDLPIFFSFKEGGFKREMLRDGSPTAPIHFQIPGGGWIVKGGSGPPGTRRMFPQATADLRTRWCSPYMKIDVFDAVIRGQSRFEGTRTLVITGERSQESANRARYNSMEVHRADARGPRLKRHVDVWRPVLGWSEAQVWDLIQQHGIMPHPAYYLGWGRLSCMTCIFGSANQWASVNKIDPRRISSIFSFEENFGKTIHRTKTVLQRTEEGTPYAAIAEVEQALVELALSSDEEWDSIRFPLDIGGEAWRLPAGAYGEGAGPT